MVAKTASMIVASGFWIALLLGSAVVDAATDRGRNLPSNYYYYDYYDYYYAKKDKKDKKYKGYYDYYGTKSDKKKGKDCKKNAKYNYYGYYDYCFESSSTEEEDLTYIDGNITNSDNDMIVDESSSSSTSWSSKGSKGGYYYYSKHSKKSKKSKSDKKGKKDKKKSDKKFGLPHNPTKVPTKPIVRNPDVGFSPLPSWDVTFPDALDTGYLFYDDVTGYVWYAYNANSGEEALVSVKSSQAADANAEAMTAEVVATSTIAKVCPIDIEKKAALPDMCIEIKAPDSWATVTSTKIQAVEACYGSVTGSIFKLAVVVEDTSKVLHLEPTMVGSRMLVYDIVNAGGDGGDKAPNPLLVEVAHEGWKSVYGEPGITGRPSFSSDCKRVYSTWLAPSGVEDVEEIDFITSITTATNVAIKSPAGESAEEWRLGTSGRLVGMTPTKNGQNLISAANVPSSDSFNTGGVVSLDAGNGSIDQTYIFPTNEPNLPHNAFTNPVVDDSGNSYHIDSMLGLIKLDVDDLNDGPVWTAAGGAVVTIETKVRIIGLSSNETETEPEATAEAKDMTMTEGQMGTRRLAPEARPRDSSAKELPEEEEAFTAYRPALDGDSGVIYGCGKNALEGEEDGVIALKAINGEKVWHNSLEDQHQPTVGSCSGVTADIIYGPSEVSSNGNAIYIARHKAVQALDSKDGSPLWLYHKEDHHQTARFVVVSGTSTVVARGAHVVALKTTAPPATTPPTAPTPPTPTADSMRPSRSPLNTPGPVPPPTPAPTEEPSSASTYGVPHAVAVFSVLPLLLALLR